MCRSRRSSRTASIRIWSPSGSSTYRSGCVRRSTRGSPPSSSDANASAAPRFPTPAGPWKRYACAGPSTSAAAKSRFASPCSGRLSKAVKDLAPDLVGRAGAVDRRDPLRKRSGQLAVGLVDASAEVGVLALDPVAGPGQPPRRLAGIDQQQVGAVREDASDRVQVQLEHALETQAAGDPLVGERGVEVAVTDDVRSASERGSNHLFDELRAGGREERGLGPRRDTQTAENQLAHLLAELRPPRLARRD